MSLGGGVAGWGCAHGGQWKNLAQTCSGPGIFIKECGELFKYNPIGWGLDFR